MHMPGHKRNAEFMPALLLHEVDITEIHGFDDLHDPRGILRETAELAATLYGSKKAFLLVNGSTVGILAAIGAHTERGDKILVAGNCHQSVNNAVSLFGLEVILLLPETNKDSGVSCSIDPAEIESALDKDPQIKLVVITSPSYEGVVSDIKSIAEASNRRAIPLLVDSAHGAHLGFSPGFPDSAVSAGADVVVMSLHKTLPAMTQCSLLHVNGKHAATDEIARLLSVLQTSSPSYVLMASIDHCLRMLASEKNRLFRDYERNLKSFSDMVMSLKKLFVLDKTRNGFFAYDLGKIVIVTKNTALSGFELADILRSSYKIEIERASVEYAIAMTSVCDKTEGFERLAAALREIDRSQF